MTLPISNTVTTIRREKEPISKNVRTQRLLSGGLFGKLFLSHMVLIIITLLVLGLFLSQLFESYFFAAKERELISRGQQVARLVVAVNRTQRPRWFLALVPDPNLDLLTGALDELLDARIVLVDDEGMVISSTVASDIMRPGVRLSIEELPTVLGGTVVRKRGIVQGMGEPTLLVGVPVGFGGRILGAIFLYTPVAGVAAAVRSVRRLVLYSALGATFLSALLGYVFSRSISRPLQKINRAALEMAKGNFKSKVSVTSDDEIGDLAKTFNYLIHTLDKSINDLADEKGRMESILTSMAEGVIACEVRDTRNDGVLANEVSDSEGGSRSRGALPGGTEGTSGKKSTCSGEETTCSEEKTTCEDIVVTMMNSRAESVLSVQKGEYVFGPVNRLGNALSGLDELLLRVIREGKPQTEEFVVGDKITYVLVHASPVRRVLDGGDERFLSGAVAVLQDITELRRLDISRRDFIANVSHELRTPLTSIKAFLEALMDDVAEDSSTRDRYFRIIQDETLRLERLIRDLLDLSLLEAGEVRWNMKPVHMEELVLAAMDKLAPRIDAKQIHANICVDEDLPHVIADADRMEQVLINLLSNAIRFSPEGSDIDVSVKRCEAERDLPALEAVRVEIRDWGPGIPPDDLPRIWDRFYRVEKSRSREGGGTGLGLSIVKEIVEAHGGYVVVQSSPGEGSTFSFTLPSGTA